jgi:hypothetical protein
MTKATPSINATFTPATPETDDGPGRPNSIAVTHNGALVLEFPAHANHADMACAVADAMYKQTHDAVLARLSQEG